MASSKRVLTAALGAIALTLTAAGIYQAATDANPSGQPLRDPLALNGYPPKTVGVNLTVTTASLEAHATVDLNLVTGQGTGALAIPLALSTATATLRLVDGTVYVNSPNFNAVSHPSWYRIGLKLPDLFGAALELTQPDIRLISGFPSHHVTHTADTTTYYFAKDNVPTSGLGGGNSQLGREMWTITTGSQGEVTKSSIAIDAGGTTTKVDASIDWYNHPVITTAPPKGDWSSVPHSLVQALLGSGALGQISLPTNIRSLGTAGSLL